MEREGKGMGRNRKERRESKSGKRGGKGKATKEEAGNEMKI